MNELWVSDGDLWRCHINHWEVREQDVLRDHLGYGYWVNPTSRTATILALKGCRFHKKQSPGHLTFSKVFWNEEQAVTPVTSR